MLYDRIIPPKSLSSFIDCYWVVESSDRTIKQQKIIPDGFPEIIFHYGDSYRLNISGEWETQTKSLIAGQIRNNFLLENTGASGMIGVKFKPAGISIFFGVDMSLFTDSVVDLNSVLKTDFIPILQEMHSSQTYHLKVERLNKFFENIEIKESRNDQIIDKALNLIFESNGIISVSEITDKLEINERKIERLFKKYVGLSPKFYSRIIRFNYIFQLVQIKKMSWSEVAHLSGFYDQSHFISNFQEFTGEDPSNYFFGDENLANFFLKRTIEN